MQDKQYIGVETVNTILVSSVGIYWSLMHSFVGIFFFIIIDFYLSVLNSVFLQLNELLQIMLKKAKCILFTLF